MNGSSLGHGRWPLIMLLMAALLPVASAADAQRNDAWRAAVENHCLFEEKILGKQQGIKGFWRKAKGKVQDAVGIDESPLCSLRSVPELLLVTSAYLGEAGLSVARGLDEAEQALQLKRSLLAEIAKLEAALNGPKLAEQLVDRTVELSRGIGQTTRLIEAELEKRQSEGYLTPEAKELIASARLFLNRAQYFQIQTMAGAEAVRQKYEDASDEERLSWLLHEEIGITGDFLEEAPKKIAQAGSDMAQSFSLAGKINKAGKRLEFEITRKEIKESNDRARKDAVVLAESLSFNA